MTGNPIVDFNEVKRIGSLESLTDLSMNDIHFGRCPVVDEAGYRDYVLLHCPGLTVLDGVCISPAHKATAKSNFKSAVKVQGWILILSITTDFLFSLYINSTSMIR